MQLLMSLPWNIEVMLSRDAVPTGGVQLRLDTWVDASPQERSRSSKMPKKATSAQSATTMVRNHHCQVGYRLHGNRCCVSYSTGYD